jgi:hypothetical protein
MKGNSADGGSGQLADARSWFCSSRLCQPWLEAVPLLAARSLHVSMHGVLPARTKKEFVIFGSIGQKCIAILSKMSTFI